MAALIAYAAGLTTSGMEILSQALTEVFGEISIQELRKDNLRYSVRMSMKSSSVVLVVLDSSSEDVCRDIENGLYMSDKYFLYSSDRGLVEFLNQKYDLELEIPEELDDISVSDTTEQDGYNDLIERYESRLSDKDGLIKTLQCTIRELQGVISGAGYIDDSAKEELQNENTSLRSTISDLNLQIEGMSKSISECESANSELDYKVKELESRESTLRANYNSVNSELVDVKVESSKKSGVIRDKNAEIDRLTKQIEGLAVFVSQHQDCDSVIAGLNNELSVLKSTLCNRDAEVDRLSKELFESGKTQEQLESYKSLLKEKQEECLVMQRKCSELEQCIEEANNSLETISSEYDSTKAELKKSESFVARLNVKNVELAGKLRVLEQSTDRDVNIEDTLEELSSLRRKYSELQTNIFSVLYSRSSPKSSSHVSLFNTIGIHYDNIRFVFSGSTESRKGTYKNLLSEMGSSPHEKYLFVDAVSETFVDYVFKIEKVVNGLKWFTDGGGVQKYITQTCLPNVRVLSPGLGYINDSFFLTADWCKRLQELEESGYSVIMYCGDISNMVGRVLFENFSELGKTDIYVHGNSVGSRTILGISMGLASIKLATVKYFDYDTQVSKFVEYMKQKCVCEVVNSISR